ncbi:uncharacterized protein LOC141496985 [Macrotis lagotis]|uniref:uncharacterized protein LOC141496985 n=1 Tax=Macrotis lagotis TaxID=92651 RepID=UPI003D6862C6
MTRASSRRRLAPRGAGAGGRGGRRSPALSAGGERRGRARGERGESAPTPLLGPTRAETPAGRAALLRRLGQSPGSPSAPVARSGGGAGVAPRGHSHDGGLQAPLCSPGTRGPGRCGGRPPAVRGGGPHCAPTHRPLPQPLPVPAWGPAWASRGGGHGDAAPPSEAHACPSFLTACPGHPGDFHVSREMSCPSARRVAPAWELGRGLGLQRSPARGPSSASRSPGGLPRQGGREAAARYTRLIRGTGVVSPWTTWPRRAKRLARHPRVQRKAPDLHDPPMENCRGFRISAMEDPICSQGENCGTLIGS